MNLLNLSHFKTADFDDLFKLADNFYLAESDSFKQDQILADKKLLNLFFEPSTRTKLSFEVAASNLGMTVFSLDAISSSLTKGESLEDTIEVALNIGIDACVIRHKDSVVHDLADRFPDMVFINAGEGSIAHPSQTLLDLFTIRQSFDDLSKLSYLVVGDLDHSRVLASFLEGLRIVGANKITLCSPAELGKKYADFPNFEEDLNSALDGKDVVMALRIQHERLDRALSISGEEYISKFQINHQRLLDAIGSDRFILMHPGPVNYGIELHADVRNQPYCKINTQVRNGVGIRMAILTKALLT